jgi:hypothetical protein
METQDIVVPNTAPSRNDELVPASPIVLDRWTETLSSMDTLEVSVTRLYQDAQALEVKDADSFARAGALIAEIKHNTAESEACLEPYKLKVRKVLDFIQQRFNKNKNRGEEARGILNKKMGDYSRIEREAAAAEEKKLNKKSAEPVTVAPNLPKTSGVRTTVNYPIEIVDRSKFLNAFLKGDKARRVFLGQFLTLDESALARHAKELKDPAKFNKELPGVVCKAVEAFGGKV